MAGMQKQGTLSHSLSFVLCRKINKHIHIKQWQITSSTHTYTCSNIYSTLNWSFRETKKVQQNKVHILKIAIFIGQWVEWNILSAIKRRSKKARLASNHEQWQTKIYNLQHKHAPCIYGIVVHNTCNAVGCKWFAYNDWKVLLKLWHKPT